MADGGIRREFQKEIVYTENNFEHTNKSTIVASQLDTCILSPNFESETGRLIGVSRRLRNIRLVTKSDLI